jgi:hypothetical protein
MKPKEDARQLWTPAFVRERLEGCPKPDGEETHVLEGWIVDGEFYCAECVHRLVENNIPLPARATPDNPQRGSIAVPLGEDWPWPCAGCGAQPET